MEDILYSFMNWAAGDHKNPMVWEPLLTELGILYIFFGIVAGIVYHFTNTHNLNTRRQNYYFLTLAGIGIALLWVYTGIRLYSAVGEFVELSNFVGVAVLSAIFLFLGFYVLSYYIIRMLTPTKKKFVPTLLTGFLKPKKQR